MRIKKGLMFGFLILGLGLVFVTHGTVVHALTLSEVGLICDLLDCDDGAREKLEELVAPQRPVPPTCVPFNRSLWKGVSDATAGGDVSRLQQFLKEEGYYAHDEITGYFGSITEAALQRWQAAQGIVSSGTPGSTGYGVFGPKTRSRACYGGIGIHVITPNGGEVRERGAEANIRWESRSLSDRANQGIADPNLFVDIYLYASGRNDSSSVEPRSALFTIAKNVENDGHYLWQVGDIVQDIYLPAGYYKVRVINPQTGRLDDSDGPFRMFDEGSEDSSNEEKNDKEDADDTNDTDDDNDTSDAERNDFRVLSPDGGETWKMGESEKITWNTTTSGFVATDSITIELIDANPTLSSSASAETVYTIAESVDNDGSYEWVVGETLEHTFVALSEGKYRIRVSNVVFDLEDESDKAFTIEQ